MDKFKNLSPQEFILGALSTAIFYFSYGWRVLGLMVLTSVLWAFGGTFWHGFRRIIIPVLTIGIATLIFKSWIPVIGLPFAIWLLYQGDGFPDHRETTKDEGSPLGRFVERFVPNMEIGGPLTKLLIVLALQICWIPVFVASRVFDIK